MVKFAFAAALGWVALVAPKDDLATHQASPRGFAPSEWRAGAEAATTGAGTEDDAEPTDATPAPKPKEGATCTPAGQCCKVCDKGQACGKTCISRSKSCHVGRGCACNASEVCAAND